MIFQKIYSYLKKSGICLKNISDSQLASQQHVNNGYWAMMIWGGWWIDRVADMNMLKCYAPPSSINSSVGTTGINNAH